MSNKLIYLDNSATTRVDPKVVEYMKPYFTDIYGNASSVHKMGISANKELESARKKIADFINAKPNEIIFMGSGSEANNFVFFQGLKLGKGKHIITTSIEHKSVLNTAVFMESIGYEVTYLPVNSDGNVSTSDLRKAIRKDTVLISIMMANNEVGTILPIKELAGVAKEHGILFHTDAVQAAGKYKLDVESLGVDMLTVTGHKLYAPKGVGFLYVKEKHLSALKPMIHGGSQEDGLRAGTENVPYILGLSKAMELCENNNYADSAHVEKLRDIFEARVLSEIPYTKVNGDLNSRVGSISNITFKYIEAEAVIGYVSEVCFSLGSACNAGEDTESHVLVAMKIDPVDIRGTIRFSFGRFNTEEEVHRAVELLKAGIGRLREMSPLFQKTL